MCRSMDDIQSATAEIMRGKKEERKNKQEERRNKEKEETTGRKYNGLHYYIGRHNYSCSNSN